MTFPPTMALWPIVKREEVYHVVCLRVCVEQRSSTCAAFGNENAICLPYRPRNSFDRGGKKLNSNSRSGSKPAKKRHALTVLPAPSGEREVGEELRIRLD